MTQRKRAEGAPCTGMRRARGRRKIGPGGPDHWKGTRQEQKADTRSKVADAIEAMSEFPTPAAVLLAGAGAFCRSSVSRNLDLVDLAQEEFNASLVAQGLVPHRTRLDESPTPRQHSLLEAERERSRDLQRQLLLAESKIATLTSQTEGLKLRVTMLEKGEADRRARRTHWTKPDAGC